MFILFLKTKIYKQIFNAHTHTVLLYYNTLVLYFDKKKTSISTSLNMKNKYIFHLSYIFDKPKIKLDEICNKSLLKFKNQLYNFKIVIFFFHS